MLPKIDGLEVCRRLRARSAVPIIMLTAKSEEIDKVLGLELGADDYITKPFSMREFRSRVKAALRRAGMARTHERRRDARSRCAALRIDPAKRTVALRGEVVPTTFVEFEILSALARSPGRVFTRDMLLARVWGDSAYRDPRTIDVHIRHLREKLEARPQGAGVPLHGARRGLPLPRRGASACASAVAAQPAGAALRLIVLGRDRDRLLRRRAAAARAGCATRSSTGWRRRRPLRGHAAQARRLRRRRSRCSRARCGRSPTRTSAEVTSSASSAGPRTRCLVLADSDTGGVEISRRAVGRARPRSRPGGRRAPTEPTRLGRQALVAEPLIENGTVRGRGRCSPTRSATCRTTSSLIRRRILVAGGIALLIAVLGGYLVARALARASSASSSAARKVAAGDFSHPIRADSDDELGQLAAAFDDMQRQLARLDRARKQFIAHGLARAAHADLLARRLPRAARRTRTSTRRRAGSSSTRSAAQVERLRKLAAELLDLSRLEAGALELRPEPTDVGQLAREVAGEFTPAGRAARLRSCTLELGGEPIEIELRPRAGGAGGAYPARQRAAAHARGDRSGRFGRPRERARSPRRRRPRPRHQAARTCPTSSSRSSPPTTTRRAPASASRSRASWPSG